MSVLGRYNTSHLESFGYVATAHIVMAYIVMVGRYNASHLESFGYPTTTKAEINGGITKIGCLMKAN